MPTLLPLAYATRNLGRSPVRLLLAVGGAAMVVLLVMAGAGFALGMDAALRSSGTPGNVILMGAGSEESLERSELSPTTAGVVAASLPEIRTLAGQPAVSSEVHAALPLRAAASNAEAIANSTRDSDTRENDKGRDIAMVRGVTPAAFLVHPQVQLLEGRAPQQGSDEVILGVSAARRAGLDPDQLRAAVASAVRPAVLIDNRPFTVVGVFQAPATVMDGEVWMPIADALILTQRETISAVVIGLQADADPADVEAFAQRRIDLELSALPETAYYAGLSAFYLPVRVMVLASAALVAGGALLGGLNTMYAAFASRVREIGMLQCLGFSRLAVMASIVQESVLASMTGALIAAAAALMWLDGIRVEFSMGTFGIAIDERVVLAGLVAGLVVGLAGCIIPAIRCLRLPIPEALKSD